MKRVGIKVYTKDFIQSQGKLKKLWYEYWNEKALELIKDNVPRSSLEGLIKDQWSYHGGKREACMRLGKDVMTKCNLDVDLFQSYSRLENEQMKEMTQLRLEI